jgi:hypothetical protein
MNSDNEYYYSNNVSTPPVKVEKLEHIAGVGSSPIIDYQGYGAYFMDKLENGVWRLEVMPDAISIRDPFERPSLKKEVTRIQWEPEPMSITLADLGNDFDIKPLNTGNSYNVTATGKDFIIKPGVYLLVRKDHKNLKWRADSYVGTLKLDEYAAPKSFDTSAYVVHKPFTEVSVGMSFTLKAKIVGVNAANKVTLMLHNSAGGRYQVIDMVRKTPYNYEAKIEKELLTPGLLSYKIVVQKGPDSFVAFPGNHPGNPADWDNYNNEEWETFVVARDNPIVLFNANNGRNEADGTPYGATYITTSAPNQLALSITSGNRRGQSQGAIGFHIYITDKLNGRWDSFGAFNKLVVKARAQNTYPVKMKIALVDDEGSAWSAYVTVSNSFDDIEIPLSSLQKDSYMLWPKPYPGFLPASFKNDNNTAFSIKRINMLEVLTEPNAAAGQPSTASSLDVVSVMLKK